MTKGSRFILSSAICALALGFAGSAFAAYNPRLLVTGTAYSLGNQAPVVIGVGQGQDDDATAVVTIYSPIAYRVTLGQAPGTRIGLVDAVVRVGALAGARSEINGTVTVQDPNQYVNNPCSPGRHEAVWLIEATLLGNALRIPVYVDRVTAGPETNFASARIRICLASPYVPPPTGAAAGASLLAAAFSVQGVFTAPSQRGRYPWQGVFVPYTPGTATPNATNAAQSTSVVSLPVQMTTSARRVRRRGRSFARVTACIAEAGQRIRGVTVSFFTGRSARAATPRNPEQARAARRVRTNARGCATATFRLSRRVTFFRAYANVPDRDITSQGCTPTIVPRCTAATLAPAFGLFPRARSVRR